MYARSMNDLLEYIYMFDKALGSIHSKFNKLCVDFRMCWKAT